MSRESGVRQMKTCCPSCGQPAWFVSYRGTQIFGYEAADNFVVDTTKEDDTDVCSICS